MGLYDTIHVLGSLAPDKKFVYNNGIEFPKGQKNVALNNSIGVEFQPAARESEYVILNPKHIKIKYLIEL